MRYLTIPVVALLFCLVSPLPLAAQRELPKTIAVPYPPGVENLEGTTVPYREAGTERQFRLAFTTKGQGDTRHGAMDYKMWYQVSTDGGKTYDTLRPLIQQGGQYSRMHPIEPVHITKNSYVYSIQPASRASNGEVMLPFWFWPLDELGQLAHINDKVYTFSAVGVLIGKWTPEGNDLTWDLGQTVHLRHADQSTRGAMEPAVVELKQPGHFLMTIRASNESKPNMPSYKWKCLSTDYCRTWSEPVPITYTDGTPFFSPSSWSDIRRHSKNGKLYWFGNISETNPKGNMPRFPLVVAEMDEESLTLIRESIHIVDTKTPEKGDTDLVQFSNFRVAEDPATGSYIITLRRLDAGRLKKGESTRTRTWPAERYEVAIPLEGSSKP